MSFQRREAHCRHCSVTLKLLAVVVEAGHPCFHLSKQNCIWEIVVIMSVTTQKYSHLGTMFVWKNPNLCSTVHISGQTVASLGSSSWSRGVDEVRQMGSGLHLSRGAQQPANIDIKTQVLISPVRASHDASWKMFFCSIFQRNCIMHCIRDKLCSHNHAMIQTWCSTTLDSPNNVFMKFKSWLSRMKCANLHPSRVPQFPCHPDLNIWTMDVRR